jgi:hypothetical protein
MKSKPIAKLWAALPALIAPAALAAIPEKYAVNLPPQHRSGVVIYRTGGTTPDEAVALKRAADEYPLEVVFVERQGRREHPLPDMPVRITDDKGKVVFDARTMGPYFLARLPKGRYTITTRWDAWSFSRPVTIGAERQRVVFAWSKPPSMDASAPMA